jgi:hypothetical protein
MATRSANVSTPAATIQGHRKPKASAIVPPSNAPMGIEAPLNESVGAIDTTQQLVRHDGLS